MLFQIFLFSSVSGSGLSNSVPLQVGVTTLFGALSTYMVDKRAKIAFFIPGVLMNIFAVFMDAITYKYLQKDNKKHQEEEQQLTMDIVKTEEPAPRFSMKKIVIVALCGAAVGIPFGPGMALAGQEPHSLSPYVHLTLFLHL